MSASNSLSKQKDEFVANAVCHLKYVMLNSVLEQAKDNHKLMDFLFKSVMANMPEEFLVDLDNAIKRLIEKPT